ncbi:MAG: lamin tail domain-containing protein [Verrucomicrobia bacterium]|nr:lamin tail domain-containing protein [Verrucomicrobiota bacterium]
MHPIARQTLTRRLAILGILAAISTAQFVSPAQAAGVFVIEAEDFNYGSGQHVAAASTMPYYGGAYQGLGAVHDVDYYRGYHDPNADEYRSGETLNVPLTPNADLDRNEWTMTTNYRIGWVGVGHWYNYTRTFPQGSYRVFAALSHDTTSPGALKGSLQRVTSGANSTSQTLQQLGVFDAPGSGGWGSNNRVPLKDTGGNEQVLALSGLNTIRYTSDSGDIDYFLFELIAPPQIKTQPADVNTTEGGSASFTVELVSTAGATYQWLRNNANLIGATNATHFIPTVTLADHNSQFRCFIANPQGTTNTRSATLTVTGDNTRPTLDSVVNLGDRTRLTVRFSEPVEASSAANHSNYSINNGISVTAASFAGDTRTIILTTSALSLSTTYTLTVNNVRDRATSPNTILANTQRSFSLDFTPLAIDLVRGSSEPIGPSSRTTGLVLSEIHYNPPPRPDNRNLEFIEIYNSEEISLDLSGFRLTGDISYTFPAGTTLNSRAYLAVAAAPADLQSVHGITGVRGPYTNSLPNNGGLLRLRNPAGAVLLEVEYNNRQPWPLPADNAGHSLVLARPSYGEQDPRAWSASEFKGGSPGAAEPAASTAYRTVVINEFLAHTDDPELDYVELYNYGSTAVDLSGCILTDNANEARFLIPAGTSIPAKGFAAFTQVQLGFALSTLGETLHFINPQNTRVLDTVQFQGQANGVATGRYPDGAPAFQELAAKTPNAPNAKPLTRQIVINEIMYNPISEDDDDEFVELHNTGGTAVSLAGWRLSDGIGFTFPQTAFIPANGFVVVGRNRDRLLLNHPTLSTNNTFGDFSGSLANSGERIALTFPETTVTTNNNVAVTNLIHIVADEVTFGDGGQWGLWSDGGGSSLELIDPRADNRLPSNWADSDESTKSTWSTIEHSGVLDLGQGAINELHLLLFGSGECLVDNLEVLSGAVNTVPNGTFESGLNSWIAQGNHVRSSLSTAGQGDSSSYSLHLRATAGGDNGANRVESDLTTTLSPGGSATIRGRARWLKGHPDLLLRLHGNHLEALGSLPIPANLGTPGAPNSRLQPNAGPAIHSVSHNPVLPTAGQTVTVHAQVSDPDTLSNLTLTYRLDPATNLVVLPMTYRGAGFYSATIPGQSAGALAAFHIAATDAANTPASSLFPHDAPAREGLIRFGEPTPPGRFGIYRLWMTEKNINLWSSREKLSNEPLDGTFVYGNHRVVYNAGGRYRGSPFIRPGYNSPVGNACGYVWTLPSDQLFLGADELNLDSLEPGGRDPTALREVTSFALASQLGLPSSHQRYVHVVINGVPNANRGIPIYSDSQQPDSSYVRSWFADDDQGEIFKIDDWFEFNDSVGMEFNVDATLQDFTTTGGAKKQARYRWAWEKKFNRTLNDDYSRLFAIVDAVNAPDATYVSQVEELVDTEIWLTAFALRHAIGDWDGYGYSRGKNQFIYGPLSGKWQMLLWDLDFSLGCNGGHDPNYPLWEVNDPTIARMYNHPHFRRIFLRALKRLVDGPMLSANYNPPLTARYQAFQANGVSTTSPFVGSGAQGISIPAWIDQRRTYILNQLSTVNAAFAITSNNGNNFSTAQNFATLQGTAPVDVRTIRVNGVAYPITWTAVTSWTLRVPLSQSVNNLTLLAYDATGKLISSLSDTITITYTGTVEPPQDFLVLNEIMFNPAAPDAEFVEIHNRSTLTTFDLSGYRLNGADLTFPEGTVIPPNGFIVAAENLAAFRTAYGPTIPVAAIFNGSLDNGGETLKLIKPGTTPDLDLLIDEVTYDDDPPWPTLADGFGPSIQLIDPTHDNNRVANWSSVTGGSGGTSGPLIGMTDTWKYNQSGTDLGTTWNQRAYNDNAWPSGAALLYVESSDLPAPKNTLLTYTAPQQTTFYFRKTFNFSGNPNATTLSAQLILDDGAVVYLNGTEVLRIGMPDGPIDYATFATRTIDNATLEGPFNIPTASLIQGLNVIAVEVHQVNDTSSDVAFGLSLDASAGGGAPYTPGAPNSNAAATDPLPLLWLNEVQPVNTTGLPDRFNERDPWVELHNSSSTTVSLDGYYLSDSYTNLTRWTFPTGTTLNPGQFRLVWLDAQPAQTGSGEIHANFRIPPEFGSVALVQTLNNSTSIVDYLNYPTIGADKSYGAYPDGTPTKRTKFYIPTPGSSNSNGHPEVPVNINEWMAGNTSTVTDPLDGQFDDWFELHNFSTDPVDLSDFTLTDNLANPAKWTIPTGTVIPAGAFLLVWADEQPDQNGYSQHLHADFKLSLNGEAIGLFTPNGILVDSVDFGAQTNDISEGRWPDAASARFFMSNPTPGAPNLIDNPVNRAPTLNPLSNPAVAEGSLLTFTASASDPDAGQSLTFSLDPGAPGGAAINPESGVFTWTPTEAQGPASYPVTVRVTDNGTPTLDDHQTITIQVNEVNRAPILNPIGNQAVDEQSLLTFTAVATDPDLPVNTLTFSLDEGAPAGAAILPATGVFTWTPTEAQGPGVYSVTIIVRDNGAPSLNASETISITVREVNQNPTLNPIADQQVTFGATLSFTAMASDPDLPLNTLAFSLEPGAPTGASINPTTGLFSWTPQSDQAPSTNSITVRVTDDGTPPLATTRGFQIVVLAAEALVIQDVNVNPTGTVTIQWNSTVGTQYRLEFKDDLDAATWTTAADYTATATTTTGNHNTSGSPHRLYRVRQLD